MHKDTVSQPMPREPEIRAYADLDQPDTTWRTARAEVLAAARQIDIWYSDVNNATLRRYLPDSLRDRLDRLEAALRQFDATPPGA